MENPTVIINLGATVCERLRIFYYKDTHWGDCFQQVCDKFTALKARARKFYVGMEDKELLMELKKYTPQDLADLLSD